jgi:methionyl aminopeptidase
MNTVLKVRPLRLGHVSTVRRLLPSHIPHPPPAPPAPRPVPQYTDLQKLRAPSAIVHDVLEACKEWVQPGVTTEEIDAKVHDMIVSRNAYPSPLNYRGFPKSSCTSINQVVCHGIPDDQPLEDGDMLNVDVSCFLDGYHGDASRMYAVGELDEDGQKLIRVTKECMDQAIAACGPGVDITVIGDIISDIAETNNYGVIRDYCGHAIGRDFHMLPYVFHHRNQQNYILREGNAFTIEPMLTEDGSLDSKVCDDGWTVVTTTGARSAQFEQTLLVTENGVEVLT